jgi:hypothetical protein
MMAYETGSATDIPDLIGKLLTFASGLSTTPWTVDEDAATQATLSLNNCVVSWMWEGTDPDMMVCYQSLGWLTSVTPPNYTDDSGGGNLTVPTVNYRQVNFLVSGPYPTYHFFAGEGSTPYIHVVVEFEANRFRHFGFGNLVKYNDFTGGEYCYGSNWNQNSSYIDVPSSAQHQCGLDHNAAILAMATMHVEGLPNQDAASKWGGLTSEGTTSAGNDRGGDPRVVMFGGARSGLWARLLSWIPVSQLNSYKPLVPIEVLYKDLSGTTDSVSFLGYQPDVAVVNINGLSVGDTISDGTDDWMVFPYARKQTLLNNTEESWNAGFAYKKIT